MSRINDVPVALLAGGLATRLAPITRTIPKALITVAGRPFVEHQLDLLHRHGIRKIVLCLGYLGHMVKEHLGDGRARGLELQYSFDGEKLLGTGGAIRRALPMLDETFFVIYGDSYMDIDYRAVLARFEASPDALALMTVIHNADRWDKSNVIFRDGNIIRYDKRHRTPNMTYIDYGVGMLRRSAVLGLSETEPADLSDVYAKLSESGHLAGFEVFERFYEIGTPASLAEADAYLARINR